MIEILSERFCTFKFSVRNGYLFVKWKQDAGVKWEHASSPFAKFERNIPEKM